MLDHTNGIGMYLKAQYYMYCRVNLHSICVKSACHALDDGRANFVEKPVMIIVLLPF